MSEKTRTALKGYFETGDTPTEAQFAHLIDSFLNLSDDFGTKYKKISVSSAEILALNSSPKELVPAPGAGKALIPIKALVSLTYGTSAYATNTILRFKNDSGDNQDDLDGVLDNGSDIKKICGMDLDAEVKENEALNLSVFMGDPTAGDGTLEVYLWYKELTL